MSNVVVGNSFKFFLSKGQDEINQAVCTADLVLFASNEGEEVLDVRKTVFFFHFSRFILWFCSHLMWTTLSSVFNRLRLGCRKSSPESSESSSSLSFVSALSVSGVSGKICPGNVSCSFSSKYRLTALPDIAISDPTCRRRKGRKKRVKSDMEEVRVPLSRRNEWVEAGRRKEENEETN